MSEEQLAPHADAAVPQQQGSYVVVARRYRPQTFDELIGQRQVSLALVNAIQTDRVGHAYLFTGARGVGKTSAARIFAKALNCLGGPSPQPCNACDICQRIATGDDVDVLEIDGASNRGIDEIRQLRSNVNVRPSRARYKIYIIDEVHMLTTQAFNALLKTLEEPPAHVKFIFCTTDPEKIPITVLSRCQRFDFPPLETDAIVQRLEQIVQSEGRQADDPALRLLARRAGGSMRDSQSLLEQLLAFCDQRITSEQVHQLLGTAPSGRLSALVGHLIDRNSAAALAELDGAVAEGVDAGQLAEQLLGYFRDMMASAVGCPADMLRHCPPQEAEMVHQAALQLGLETILAVLEILDQTLTRLRQSSSVRTLVELAVVRICKLEDLEALSTLVAQLRDAPRGGHPSAAASAAASRTAPPTQKKTEGQVDPSPTEAGESHSLPALTAENADSIWKQALTKIGDMTADFAGYYDHVAISGPNQLVVHFKAGYNLQKESCERPNHRARIEQALARITGREIRVDFATLAGSRPASERPPVKSRRQLMKEKEKHPLVSQAIELFDAELVRLEPRRTSHSDRAAD